MDLGLGNNWTWQCQRGRGLQLFKKIRFIMLSLSSLLLLLLLMKNNRKVKIFLDEYIHIGFLFESCSPLHIPSIKLTNVISSFLCHIWTHGPDMIPQPEPKSVSQFSCSVVSNYLRPHGLQHARLPCPSPTSRAYSNSCPLSR